MEQTHYLEFNHYYVRRQNNRLEFGHLWLFDERETTCLVITIHTDGSLELDEDFLNKHEQRRAELEDWHNWLDQRRIDYRSLNLWSPPKFCSKDDSAKLEYLKAIVHGHIKVPNVGPKRQEKLRQILEAAGDL